MKDIIERLLGGTTFPDSSCMPDAATEITTLRAKVKELTQDVLVRNNLMSQDHKLVVSLREQLAAMTQERDHYKEMDALHIQSLGLKSEQLAASQAREQQLREALEFVRYNTGDNSYANMRATKALALPSDTTALDRRNKRYAAGVLEEFRKRFSSSYMMQHFIVGQISEKAEQLRKEAGE